MVRNNFQRNQKFSWQMDADGNYLMKKVIIYCHWWGKCSKGGGCLFRKKLSVIYQHIDIYSVIHRYISLVLPSLLTLWSFNSKFYYFIGRIYFLPFSASFPQILPQFITHFSYNFYISVIFSVFVPNAV